MGIKVLEVNVDDYLHGGVYQLVTGWVRNFPEEYKLDIAALEPFEDPAHIEELKAQGCDVYYVGSDTSKIKKQLAIYRNVKELLNKEHYDVVHLHSDVAHKILVSGLAAKKCAVPKIIFHSHATGVEGGHEKLRVIFHKMCARLLKTIPAIHLATSEDAGKWMFPGDKDVTVLNNGVEYDRYYYNEKVRRSLRLEMGIDGDFALGSIGRFTDAKNPFFLIDIMEQVKKEIPEAVLYCIGEGGLKEKFIRRVEERGLQDKIKILGGVDNAQDYYQAMDMMLMPSNFEGFGLVAVESQVSGTPILASDRVPSMTRISDLITYLPIGEGQAQGWCDEIKKGKDHIKTDVREQIDHVFDLRFMIEKLAKIYRS